MLQALVLEIILWVFGSRICGCKLSLTIELQPFQDKIARILCCIAAELWLRKGESDIQRTLDGVARSMTLRLAEHLAQYIGCLMRQASELATPHALGEADSLRFSELLGAAREPPGPNKNRAPIAGQ